VKTFRVLVVGRNFLLAHIDGKSEVVSPTGFYTTRFVNADDATAAEYQAMAAIRADEKLRSALRNARTNPPIMVAENVEEVPSILDDASESYVFFTGKGAGRPRDITLAAFPDDAPEGMKEAATRRYGKPGEASPPQGSGESKKDRRGDA